MSEVRGEKSEVKRTGKYSIRRATARDLPDLKRMRIALQDLLTGRDPRVWRLSQELSDRLEEFYATTMEKDENRIFVADAPAGRPVGMLLVRVIDNPNMDPRPFGRIDDAWVDPEWRAAAQFLADRRVVMVMLDWANNNPPSGTCWQKLGFEPLMTMGFASPTDILSRKE
jgi:ribosomal protein S18 acetylase RimI-like enzyme